MSLFYNKELTNELVITTAHFRYLVNTITILGKSTVTLKYNPLLIENIKNKFDERGSGIDFTRSKFTNVLSKNREYSRLKKNR